MKDEIPAAIPASIVSAKAGLAAISANIVPPAGTDLYTEFVNDVPMMNNNGIATISPTDHFPNEVIGRNFEGLFCHIIFLSHLANFWPRIHTNSPSHGSILCAFCGEIRNALAEKNDLIRHASTILLSNSSILFQLPIFKG